MDTARKVLRHVCMEDAAWILGVENDPQFWIYGDNQSPYEPEDIENCIKDCIHGLEFQPEQIRMIIELDGKPVGMVDLFDIDYDHLRAGVGILIFEPSARGQGLAAEAIREVEVYAHRALGMHQLHCSVKADNIPGKKLFEGLSYMLCGERKDWYRSDADHFVSELLYQKNIDQSIS